jgi:WD40 repeat protein
MGFLADNTTLVTAGQGSSIQFWEAQSGRLLREIDTSLISIGGFALSRDGKMLVVGGSLPREGNSPPAGAIRVLETATGKEIRTLPWTDPDVTELRLACTPDNKHVISLGHSGMLRIEEIATGTEILKHAFPRDVGNYLALSPDGSTIALASGPNTRKVFLWKWLTGEEPHELKFSNRVEQLCFSPDGAMLAGCEQVGGTVYIWNMANNKLDKTLHPPAGFDVSGKLVFSPDGTLLAVPDRGVFSPARNHHGSINLWSVATGKIVREFSTLGDAAMGAAFSADGHWLAAGCEHRAHVWDFQTGLEVGAGDPGHSGIISQMAATNSLIATVSDDHTVRLWDPLNGRELRKFEHDHWVRGSAVP